MIRIAYRVDGEPFEEVISIRTNRLPKHLLSCIESVYIFDRDKTLKAETAQRYVRFVQNAYFLKPVKNEKLKQPV